MSERIARPPARAGGRRDERAAIDLRRLLAESTPLIRGSVPGTPALECRIDEDLPKVRANPERIRELLAGILRHALGRAAPGGRVSLRASRVLVDEAQRRALGLAATGAHACLVVADDGETPAPEVAESIFAAPGRAPGRARPPEALSGLGDIVRAHDGAIGASPRGGGGLEVTVWLPGGSPSAAGGSTAREPGGAGRVLFVDDEESLTRPAELLLSRRGFEVVLSTDAERALEIVRRDPAGFAVIVCDLYMPGTSGLDLIAELRAAGSPVPVVLCSGFLEEHHRSRATALGVRHFLHKPYTGDGLVSAVKEAMAAPGLNPS